MGHGLVSRIPPGVVRASAAAGIVILCWAAFVLLMVAGVLNSVVVAGDGHGIAVLMAITGLVGNAS